MSESAKCALCLEEKELICSHVLPRWFWREIKNNGKYKQISFADNSVKNSQDDKKEPLMCQECDRSFTNTERRIKYLYSNWLNFPRPRKLSIPFPGEVNVPYKEVKIFQLLTMWRMSISSNETFNRVNLPATLLETLRQMLLSMETPPEDFLPLTVIVDSKGAMKRSFEQPIWTDDEKFLWFAGGAWWISSDSIEEDLWLTRKRQGKLPIAGLVDITTTPSFEKLLWIRENQGT